MDSATAPGDQEGPSKAADGAIPPLRRSTRQKTNKTAKKEAAAAPVADGSDDAPKAGRPLRRASKKKPDAVEMTPRKRLPTKARSRSRSKSSSPKHRKASTSRGRKVSTSRGRKVSAVKTSHKKEKAVKVVKRRK